MIDFDEDPFDAWSNEIERKIDDDYVKAVRDAEIWKTVAFIFAVIAVVELVALLVG
jgi:hypothetical protein